MELSWVNGLVAGREGTPGITLVSSRSFRHNSGDRPKDLEARSQPITIRTIAFPARQVDHLAIEGFQCLKDRTVLLGHELL